MDIDDESLHDLGADIGVACDNLLSSDCSLVGGLYHLTTGTGNLWADVDRHLGPYDIGQEEAFSKRFPEPFPGMICDNWSPRNDSVCKYMSMRSRQVTPVDNNKRCLSVDREIGPVNVTPGQPDIGLLADQRDKVTKSCNTGKQHIPRKIRLDHTKSAEKWLTSDKVRPKTADQYVGPNVARTTTFFRLGEYVGSRPYTVASGYRDSKKTKFIPHFPEIQIQFQDNPASISENIGKEKEAIRLKSPQDATQKSPPKGVSANNKAPPRNTNAVKKSLQNNMNANRPKQSSPRNERYNKKSPATGVATKPLDKDGDNKSERQRADKPQRHQRVKQIKVKPTSELKEAFSGAEKVLSEREDGLVKSHGKPNRLRKALSELGQSLRSLFLSCTSSRK